MKKTMFFVAVAALLGATSCQKKGCTDPSASNYNSSAKKDDGSCTYSGDNYVELTGNLETRTLTKDKKYLIKGQVFVGEGKVLTIEPGTVIFGDKATKGTLIIDRGGKIEANGTAQNPIVFTSSLPAGARDKGDWGGLVILGKAKQNQPNPAIEGITPAAYFGGEDDTDNSGTLKYVRVEFAGIELTPNNETNSITLGGVGSGTTMEYCQVSYGGDDGFEWFGGNVDGKYLISFGTWDDCFDVDYGYSGRVQFGLSVRYPSFADQSGSNAFECDNGPNDNVTNLLTTGVFSNFTCVGPILTSTQNPTTEAWSYQSINANYQHALDLRRRTAVTIANSVFVGYPRGLRMNQKSVYDNYNDANPKGYLLNNVMSAPRTTYAAGEEGFVTADVKTLWEANNTTSTSGNIAAFYQELGLNSDIFYGNNVTSSYSVNPTFAVTSGTLTTGASFTNSKLSTWFTSTAFRGAFGATDWTEGWAEFRPISREY
jgi:hypothetical protein